MALVEVVVNMGVKLKPVMILGRLMVEEEVMERQAAVAKRVGTQGLRAERGVLLLERLIWL